MNPTWEETDQDHIYEQKRKSRWSRVWTSIAEWRTELTWFSLGLLWGHILTHQHWMGF